MPSRAWVVTSEISHPRACPHVSMPSRAWVVTSDSSTKLYRRISGFQCPLGLELLRNNMVTRCYFWISFQCPLGLELLQITADNIIKELSFQCPLGLELLPLHEYEKHTDWYVSMPSRAWVVTISYKVLRCQFSMFQCPLGLELLHWCFCCLCRFCCVSMPSRAWVVTARMPNILNFSWCFLCIPAIYRCILAHLPIFFNQLSKFLRCESPSTFLGTCLSHHSFIIFLVTNTNTLLSGLYLISTALSVAEKIYNLHVSMPSRAYTSFLRYLQWHMMQCITMCQCPLGLIPHFYAQKGTIMKFVTKSVNALSGLYLISTVPLQKPRFYAVSRACFCRYLSEYSDNSRFSCMLTFWTYLMRYTYPWHWIKYSTKYNRCHPIFSLSW